jgi:hypothetical protein
MSESVQEILNAFDRLPEAERLEALSEILKRTGDDAIGALNSESMDPLSDEDEELVRLAEMTFLELDAREAADGNP